MDILLEVISILKSKSWYDELQTEFNEAFEYLLQEQKEELLNILKSDKVSQNDIKHLFTESTRTSQIYQRCNNTVK